MSLWQAAASHTQSWAPHVRLLICVCGGGCDWAAQGPLSRPPHTPRSFVGALMPCLGVRKRITRQIAVSPLHPPGPAALPPSAVSSVTQLGPLPKLFPRPPPPPQHPTCFLWPQSLLLPVCSPHTNLPFTQTHPPRVPARLSFSRPFPPSRVHSFCSCSLNTCCTAGSVLGAEGTVVGEKKKRERKKQGDLLVLMAVTCWLGGHRQKRRVEIVWLDAHEWLWGRGMKGE